MLVIALVNVIGPRMEIACSGHVLVPELVAPPMSFEDEPPEDGRFFPKGSYDGLKIAMTTKVD